MMKVFVLSCFEKFKLFDSTDILKKVLPHAALVTAIDVKSCAWLVTAPTLMRCLCFETDCICLLSFQLPQRLQICILQKQTTSPLISQWNPGKLGVSVVQRTFLNHLSHFLHVHLHMACWSPLSLFFSAVLLNFFIPGLLTDLNISLSLTTNASFAESSFSWGFGL